MKECKYRPTSCFYKDEGCIWIGPTNDLQTHVEESSKEHNLLFIKRIEELKRDKASVEAKFEKYKREEKKKLNSEIIKGMKRGRSEVEEEFGYAKLFIECDINHNEESDIKCDLIEFSNHRYYLELTGFSLILSIDDGERHFPDIYVSLQHPGGDSIIKTWHFRGVVSDDEPRIIEDALDKEMIQLGYNREKKGLTFMFAESLDGKENIWGANVIKHHKYSRV